MAPGITYLLMHTVETIRTWAERYWGYLVLLAWGGALLGFGIVRFDGYGLDEGAARGLILVWAIGDRVLNPLITLGIPDLRAFLFLPLGFYWAGSVPAAKVFTLAIAFAGVVLLYRWCERTTDREAAVLAGALLLVFPLFINQVDAIGPGAYLLFAFGVGALLGRRYRESDRIMGAWYFFLLLWVAGTITLHPLALALPAALAWQWRDVDADNLRRRRHLLFGLALVTGTVLAIKAGWPLAAWLENPFVPLSSVFQGIVGVTGAPSALVGTALMVAALLIAWIDRRFLLSDLLGSTLLFGTILGLVAADAAWALVVVALVIVRGMHHMLRLNDALAGGRGGLLRQRGIVLGLFFIVATASMLADKARALAIEEQQLGPRDSLIRVMAQEIEQLEDTSWIQIASQWPGRTMIVTRVNTFPLPRVHEDESREEFLRDIGEISHLIFDPREPGNLALSRLLAGMTDIAKTAEMSDAGVIIQIVRDPNGTNGNVRDTPAAPASD